MPEPSVKNVGKTSSSPFARTNQPALEKLAEESFAIHMRHGGDYINENPITGRPGEFHLSSTGRKERAPQPPPPASQQPAQAQTAAPTLNTKVGEETKKEGKADKSPRTPGASKPKRKRSKISGTSSGGTNTAAPTPQPS